MTGVEQANELCKTEIEELKEVVFSLKKENADLKCLLEEAEAEKKKTGNEILKKQLEADKKLKSADYVYLTALKEAKYFSDGFQKSLGGGTDEEKTTIIDLLRDLFKDLKDSSAKDNVKKGVSALRGNEKIKEESQEEFEFDLEEAINPKGELSLEELCKELGVYNG